MPVQFTLKQQFPVPAEMLYNAWLDSEQHTKMTGGEASFSNEVGDSFTAWDGYISGKNISLSPNKEIRQSWRTTEFGENDPDSELLIQFQDNAAGCLLMLMHKDIPDGQSNYEQGWEDHYFSPMRNYFS